MGALYSLTTSSLDTAASQCISLLPGGLFLLRLKCYSSNMDTGVWRESQEMERKDVKMGEDESADMLCRMWRGGNGQVVDKRWLSMWSGGWTGWIDLPCWCKVSDIRQGRDQCNQSCPVEALCVSASLAFSLLMCQTHSWYRKVIVHLMEWCMTLTLLPWRK